jgi:hypothetical protein
MQHVIVSLLFHLLRFSRCPTCGSWGRFSRPTPAVSGPIPPEVQGLVPLICKCPRGCTSSVQAITSLERRAAHVEA